jgi:hypothetical protein
MTLLAGGVVQNERGDSARFWGVPRRRTFMWRTVDGGDWVETDAPIPGEPGAVLTADPFGSPLVVLVDGSAWRFLKRPGARGRWLRQPNLVTGRCNAMSFLRSEQAAPKMAEPPRLLAAWVSRSGGSRRIVAVTFERTVVVLSEGAVPRAAVSSPVPGDAAVLAATVDAVGVTVLTAAAEVLLGTARGWVRLSGPEGEEDHADIRLRALLGFNLAVGRKVTVGEVFTVGGQRARELVAKEWAEPAGDGP